MQLCGNLAFAPIYGSSSFAVVDLYVTFSIQDPLPIKLFGKFFQRVQRALLIPNLVYTIAILDTVQTGFLTDLSYGLLVTRWGDVEGLAHRPWTALTLLVVNGLGAWRSDIFTDQADTHIAQSPP